MALFLDSTGQLVVAASMPAGGSAVAGAATSNLVDTAPWFRLLDDGTAQWHPANYYASGGESALVIDGRLTLSAAVIPAANDGTTSASNFTLATGTFNVFLGTLDVTNSCSFAIDSVSNLTATINASTGIYSATAMPTASDTGSVTFAASYKGQTIKLTFLVTKSKNGANGSGVNVMNPRYCTFEESALPPVLTANGIATLESNNGFFGKKSLRLQANLADCFVELRDANTSFNVFLQPNKKWILSFYVLIGGANPIPIGQVEGFVILQNGGFANITNTSPIAPNIWARVSGVIDLTSHTSTAGFVRLDNNIAGNVIWYDGIMLEAQAGDNTQPSPYHEPPNFLTTFIGDLEATKNRIYRQSTAPTGGTYSTGDLWFDTDSNPPTFYQWSNEWNIVSNAITTGSQIGVADGATKNTLTSGTANPTGGASGDIYVQTVANGKTVWNNVGGTWVSSADTTLDKIGGSGVNVCNPRYCTFEEATLPPLALVNGTAALNTSIKYFGTKSLALTATANDCYVYLGTVFNTPIQANKKWILSFFVYSTTTIAPVTSASTGVEGYLQASDGTHYVIVNTEIIPANTWKRVSGVIDLSSNNSTMCRIRLDNNTSGTVKYFDGVMLEELIGTSTAPSAFHEPPNFLTTYTGDLNATNGAIWGSNISGQPTSLSTLNATDGINLTDSVSRGNSNNLVPNSDFSAGIGGWEISYIQVGGGTYTFTKDLGYPDWTPAGGHAIGLLRAGTSGIASGFVDIKNTNAISIKGGARYELSAYLASHRCYSNVGIKWYKLVGGIETFISEILFTSPTQAGGGQNLNSWYRAGGFLTAPTEATYAYVYFRAGSQLAADPYFWATKIYFGEAYLTQTQLAAYSNSGYAVKNYSGSSDPTLVANTGDTYLNTTTGLIWVYKINSWQKTMPLMTSSNVPNFIANNTITDLITSYIKNDIYPPTANVWANLLSPISFAATKSQMVVQFSVECINYSTSNIRAIIGYQFGKNNTPNTPNTPPTLLEQDTFNIFINAASSAVTVPIPSGSGTVVANTVVLASNTLILENLVIGDLYTFYFLYYAPSAYINATVFFSPTVTITALKR